MNEHPPSPPDPESEPPRAEARQGDRRGWPRLRSWTEVRREGARTITRVFCYVNPVPDTVWVIEHDPAAGVFRVTGPDGQTSTFSDRPVRYLLASPGGPSGEVVPAIRQGDDAGPIDVFLCREVR